MRSAWASIAVGATGILLTCVVPAAAVQRYGRPVESVETRAIMALRGSARCATNDTPSSARKLLDTAIASDEEDKRAKSLMAVARKCYPTNWPAFPSTMIRGSVAEALYLEAHRTAVPKAPSAPAPATFGVVPPGTKGTPEQEIAWTLAAVANCVVYGDVAGVHDFLIGPVAVDEEGKRFAALRPALERCLPAQQARVLTPPTFRGYLADAMYRYVTTGAAGEKK